MELTTKIRGAIIDRLLLLEHEGQVIPVFDEVVNNEVTIPEIMGAKVYVVIQDQEQQLYDIQNVCEVTYVNRITIRVVTIWPGNVGGKKLSEDIREKIYNLVADQRGKSKLAGIQMIISEVRNSVTEYTDNELAITGILILKIISNE